MSLQKLGKNQSLAVEALAAEPGLTIKALGDRLTLSDVRYSSSSVKLLARLGYVRQVGTTPSPKNVPQARWSLTLAGLDLHLERHPEANIPQLLKAHAQHIPEARDLYEIMQALREAGVPDTEDIIKRVIRYGGLLHGVPKEDQAVMLNAMVFNHTAKALKGRRAEKFRKRVVSLYPKHKQAVDRVVSFVQGGMKA